MTNIERQKSLDKSKWLSSQMYKRDLSGSMIYCAKCDKAKYNHTCQATQKEREALCLCAKAYNRMVRQKV